MEDLQKICTTMGDKCLQMIRDNLNIIHLDPINFLLGDFRANASEWKAIAQPKDIKNVSVSPFPSNNPNSDKRRLYFIFLLNDGLVEGYLFLLQTETVLNYGLYITKVIYPNTKYFTDTIAMFQANKGHPLHTKVQE